MGVGHGTYGGETAGSGRHTSGLNGFLVFITRIPEMDMHVDKTGGDKFSIRIDDPIRFFTGHVPIRRQARSRSGSVDDFGDFSVLDQDIHDPIDISGIDNTAVSNQRPHRGYLPSPDTKGPCGSQHRW